MSRLMPTFLAAAIATTSSLMAAPVALAEEAPAPKQNKPSIQLVTKTVTGVSTSTFLDTKTTTTSFKLETQPLDWDGWSYEAKINYRPGERPSASIMGTDFSDKLGVSPFAADIVYPLYEDNWFATLCSLCTCHFLVWPNWHVHSEFRNLMTSTGSEEVKEALAKADSKLWWSNAWITGAWIGLIGGTLGPIAATGFNFSNTGAPMLGGALGLVGGITPLFLSRWSKEAGLKHFADGVRAYNETVK